MDKKDIVRGLINIVSKENIIKGEKGLSKYNKDWRGFYNFKSICVVFPKSADEISKILNFCFTKNIKVVPQSGNTNLTGASVPSKNNYEIIINLNKMNKILVIDKVNMLVEVDSGATLDSINKFVDKNNFYFPLNLSSSGSCLIGGNIATNAGGINALVWNNKR